MTPYKVVSYEAGTAHVVDRMTGRKLGACFFAWGVWKAYRFEGRTGVLVGSARRRADAVRLVWEARANAAALAEEWV